MTTIFQRTTLGVSALIAAALLVACGHDNEPGHAEYNAEITRTSYGVPHIKANDAKGLGYGVGYAYAQDNACVLLDLVTTANGERSKYFGPNGTDQGLNGGGPIAQFTTLNLNSDVYFKYLNADAQVATAWSQQSAELQQLITGYAAGFNRYVQSAGSAALAPACAGQAWVRAITPQDLVKVMRVYAVANSGLQLADAVAQAQPPGLSAAGSNAPGASTVLPAPTTLKKMAMALDQQLHGKTGSNGVALGANATSSGAGLLLANPHLLWNGAFRFYQMHLNIPGKLNVFGGSLGGVPVVHIGFNDNVAWTHTTNTSAHFTLFALQLDPGDATRYIVNGQSRPMTKQTLNVEVADGKGGMQTVTRTLYLSEYGPLVAIPGTLDWSHSMAFALADANAQNNRLMQQWWAMDQATSLDAFQAAVNNNIGDPWNNVLATDAAGGVYFGDVTPVPHVTAAQQAQCIPASLAPLTQFGLYILDGSSTACAWGNDPGTPQPGIFAVANLPSLRRTDFAQNSNDSAWLTNPAQPLTGFAPIVNVDGTQQGGRTRIGLSQISARLAGTDGLSGNRFTMQNLQSIAFSNQSYFATQLLSDLRAACVGAGSVTLPDGSSTNLSTPCAVLNRWDGKANVDSVGWPLFLAWRQAMDASGVDYWAVPFDPANPVSTPRGLRLSDATVTQATRSALGQAVQTLAAQGLDYTLPWGQIQVAVRGNQRIPMHGGEGDDIYNVTTSVGNPVGQGQFDTYNGSSLILTVSFEGGKPSAQGFLTYSQSTNPASPYYADQTQRFSAKQWISYPFTDAQIAADPNVKTTTLSSSY